MPNDSIFGYEGLVTVEPKEFVNLSILKILFTTSSILKAQVQFKPLMNNSFQFLFQRLSFPKSHLRMISLELAMFPVVGSGGLRSIG